MAEVPQLILQHPNECAGYPAEIFPAWGKLTRHESGQLKEIHPLLDHMTDVAACFLALTECSAIRRSLNYTASRILNGADLQRLAVLVFLHDVGKANAGFQSRRWQLPAHPPGYWPTSPFGHGPEGWELIAGRVPNAEQYADGLPIAEILTWGDVAVAELLQASISHHGRPLDEDPTKQTDTIWKPVLDKNGAVLYDPSATLVLMGNRLRQSYPLAFAECHQPLPNHSAFVHLFAGLVQLADWLGSDTRDSFFPYSIPDENRIKTAPARAIFAVHAIGLDVGRWREKLYSRPPVFAQAFDVARARPMQEIAGELTMGRIVVL